MYFVFKKNNIDIDRNDDVQIMSGHALCISIHLWLWLHV